MEPCEVRVRWSAEDTWSSLPRLSTDPRLLYELETDEGFSFEDLLQEFGRLELKAPAW
jgi:hypothetical protein